METTWTSGTVQAAAAASVPARRVVRRLTKGRDGCSDPLMGLLFCVRVTPECYVGPASYPSAIRMTGLYVIGRRTTEVQRPYRRRMDLETVLSLSPRLSMLPLGEDLSVFNAETGHNAGAEPDGHRHPGLDGRLDLARADLDARGDCLRAAGARRGEGRRRGRRDPAEPRCRHRGRSRTHLTNSARPPSPPTGCRADVGDVASASCAGDRSTPALPVCVRAPAVRDEALLANAIMLAADVSLLDRATMRLSDPPVAVRSGGDAQATVRSRSDHGCHEPCW